MAIEMGLKPSAKLPEWHKWVIDEYDIEGKKIPWFNSKDRKKIGNLS
jgi:hypothetical protein